MLTPPAALCALLFASGGPVEKKSLLKLLGVKEGELAVTVSSLKDSLNESGLALIETENELELRTSSEAAEIVKKLYEDDLKRDLGKGSLEALAVIAYHQGATRGEIDWVRGVNSSASLRTLLMRGLIEGKEDPADKRRMRYELTTDALAHLGLNDLTSLPRFAELRAKAEEVLQEKEAPAGESVPE